MALYQRRRGMKNNNNIVETIKERLDIAEFIRQYVPGLKRSGKTWKACCPFHNEKTPSFTCNSEKGLFYCFGCQAAGDIFTFLMKMENLSFNEALRKLADLAGVEYQPIGQMTADEQRRMDTRKLLDFAKNFYHRNLMGRGGEGVRNYIKKRNLTKETAEKFELGYAPNNPTGFCQYARANGYTPEALKTAGLCVLTPYGARDYYRGRLMFPIINQRGETVGFGGRILGDGEPKYLNSPDTILFSKSKVLYGLNFAGPAIRQAGKAVLLEGYMDVIGCHQAGVEYTVAPLGTSLTAEHAKLLKRYTQNVTVLFDPDSAGIKAALRGGLILIENGLFVKVAALPEGLDPDEYIAQYGKESFENILAKAQDLIEFHTRLQLCAYPQPLCAQDKTQVVSELVETVAKQPDEIVRREWVKYVAERVNVDEQLVLERLHQQTAAPKYTVLKTAAPRQETAAQPASPIEEDLISWLLHFPLYAPKCAALTQTDFEDPRLWELFAALQKAYRENPASGSLTEQTINNAPGLKNEIIKLSLVPIPEDFSPERDIEECASKIAKAGVQKQLAALQHKMKTLGSGNVPHDMVQLYMQLQKKLKN